jgi:hypothetical protein
MKFRSGIITVLVIVFSAFLITDTCFSDEWDTSTPGYVTTNGNVGIGTANPTTKLEIKSGGNADIRITNNNDGNYWELNTTNSGNFDINREGKGSVLRLKKNGKVGIGTTSPQEKLEVVGNIKVNGNIVSDGDICIGKCN